jgi:hypothetical protein
MELFLTLYEQTNKKRAMNLYVVWFKTAKPKTTGTIEKIPQQNADPLKRFRFLDH